MFRYLNKLSSIIDLKTTQLIFYFLENCYSSKVIKFKNYSVNILPTAIETSIKKGEDLKTTQLIFYLDFYIPWGKIIMNLKTTQLIFYSLLFSNLSITSLI